MHAVQMNEEKKIVVYAPLARAYSEIPQLAYTPNYERFVGRVFRLLHINTQERFLTLEPLECGASIRESFGICGDLDLIPSVSTSITQIKLPNREDIRMRLYGAEDSVGLYLRSDSSFSAPRLSYAHYGIVWGQPYKIKNWVVPGKVVQFEGLTLCFYAGFFDPA